MKTGKSENGQETVLLPLSVVGSTNDRKICQDDLKLSEAESFVVQPLIRTAGG
jgi:hypothetical protein